MDADRFTVGRPPAINSGPSAGLRDRACAISGAVAIGSFAATTACVVLLVQRAIPDDAFIYLRYADNLLGGHGWAFNAGQPSDAATSPAYTLLLAMIRGLGTPGPASLLLAFGLGLFGLALVLYHGLKDTGRLAAWATATVVIVWPGMLHVVGLETSFFLAVLGATALAYDRRCLWAAGTCAGIAALGRPEGIAVVPLLVALEVCRRDRQLIPIALPVVTLVVPWKLFEWISFGSLIPHTTQVKAIQSHYNFQSWISAFYHQVPDPVVMFPLAVIGCLGAVQLMRRSRPFAVIVIAFGAVQVVAYALVDAPSWYPWYFAPGNLSLIVAAALGISQTMQGVRDALVRHSRSGPDRRRVLHPAPGMLVVLLGAALLAQSLFASGELGRLRSPYRFADQYMRIAQWLRGHAPPTAWVATGKIGYIGFYSGLNVLDTMGLAEDDSAALLSRQPWYWWFATRGHPRFIVAHVPAWPGEPQPAGRPAAWPKDQYREFVREYGPVYMVSTSADRGREIIVYGRRREGGHFRKALEPRGLPQSGRSTPAGSTGTDLPGPHGLLPREPAP